MQKLSGPIDGTLITAEFFPEYKGHENQINMGECMHWAYIAEKLYEDVQLWSNHSHAFVRQNKLFFDSESPHGIRTWQRLKCNRACGVVWSSRYTWGDYQEEWIAEGCWHEMDKKIETFWYQRQELIIPNADQIRSLSL